MLVIRRIVGIFAALAGVGAATSALAAGSVVQTASASASINVFVSMSGTQNLAFGTIVKPGNANPNTVSVSNNGTRSISGAGDGSLGAGSPTQAIFSLTAPAGTTYTTSGSLTMTPAGLDNVTANTPSVTSGTLGTVPAGGIQDLNVGGSFDVTAATPAQSYTGTLTLTVDYN